MTQETIIYYQPPEQKKIDELKRQGFMVSCDDLGILSPAQQFDESHKKWVEGGKDE